jgi:hypothetical protein
MLLPGETSLLRVGGRANLFIVRSHAVRARY